MKKILLFLVFLSSLYSACYEGERIYENNGWRESWRTIGQQVRPPIYETGYQNGYRYFIFRKNFNHPSPYTSREYFDMLILKTTPDPACVGVPNEIEPENEICPDEQIFNTSTTTCEEPPDPFIWNLNGVSVDCSGKYGDEFIQCMKDGYPFLTSSDEVQVLNGEPYCTDDGICYQDMLMEDTGYSQNFSIPIGEDSNGDGIPDDTSPNSNPASDLPTLNPEPTPNPDCNFPPNHDGYDFQSSFSNISQCNDRINSNGGGQGTYYQLPSDCGRVYDIGCYYSAVNSNNPNITEDPDIGNNTTITNDGNSTTVQINNKRTNDLLYSLNNNMDKFQKDFKSKVDDLTNDINKNHKDRTKQDRYNTTKITNELKRIENNTDSLEGLLSDIRQAIQDKDLNVSSLANNFDMNETNGFLDGISNELNVTNNLLAQEVNNTKGILDALSLGNEGNNTYQDLDIKQFVQNYQNDFQLILDNFEVLKTTLEGGYTLQLASTQYVPPKATFHSKTIDFDICTSLSYLAPFIQFIIWVYGMIVGIKIYIGAFK